MWRPIACWSASLALILGGAATGHPQQQQAQQNAHLYGQVVRTDPQTSTMVIRSTEGNKKVDLQFKVETATQYWGADRKPFFDGLTNKGFKQGTDVWYQLGTGNKQSTITHLRMYDPAPPPKTPEPLSNAPVAQQSDKCGNS
jgi:hypothetical protein